MKMAENKKVFFIFWFNSHIFGEIAANGSGLCEVADFGAEKFSFALMFNRITFVEFST